MQEDRRNAAEADEDGGGGDEKYEIKALRKTVGSGEKYRIEGICNYLCVYQEVGIGLLYTI